VVAQPTLAVQDPLDHPVVLDPGLVLPVVLDPALVVVDVAVVEVEVVEEVLAQAPAVALADLLVVVRETDLVQSPVHLLLLVLLLLFLRSATPRQAVPA